MNDSQSVSETIMTTLKQAYDTSTTLATLKGEDRNQGVKAMAEALEAASDDLLEANTLDLETCREMAVPEIILDWLKLTPERLQRTVKMLKRLATLNDPIGQISSAVYQLDPSQTYCQQMPLGIIGLVYEAFPELGVIAAGLCLKTGNSLVLRGGSEASHSNGIIAQALQSALEKTNIPPSALTVLSSDSGTSVQELVTQDQYLNLIIPYGRPSLVQQVVQQATAPVLRSAMGNSYLYWSPNADLDLVRSIIIDSHATEPDAVNAIEKVLVNRTQNPSSLLRLLNSLKDKGFDLQGDEDLSAEFPEQLTPTPPAEWNMAYLDRRIAFKVVDDLDSAIAWMKRYSSSHADCIVTESYEESRQFALKVDSALVYINTSPRFYRRSPKGDAVFLGVSNQKGYRRGLIGMEALTTMKQVVQG
jgi:glutamate-5-semialdehyde dehydrogenase